MARAGDRGRSAQRHRSGGEDRYAPARPGVSRHPHARNDRHRGGARNRHARARARRSAQMNPRAVIADDEPLMREQLRVRLREAWPELEIVGEARNGIEAVEKTATLQPDLVFLDIRMPGMTGIEAAREIATLEPELGVPRR